MRWSLFIQLATPSNLHGNRIPSRERRYKREDTSQREHSLQVSLKEASKKTQQTKMASLKSLVFFCVVSWMYSLSEASQCSCGKSLLYFTSRHFVKLCIAVLLLTMLGTHVGSRPQYCTELIYAWRSSSKAVRTFDKLETIWNQV